MGKYIKTFDTTSEYEAYITGQDKKIPNVSLCKDTPLIAHYTPQNVIYELHNRYFSGQSADVINTGIKLWDGTHTKFRIDAIYDAIPFNSSMLTLFACKPDAKPYSGLRVRGQSQGWTLTISDGLTAIKNPYNYSVSNDTYGGQVRTMEQQNIDTVSIIRDGSLIWLNRNGKTVKLSMNKQLTNDMNLVIGCDYKGANAEYQRFYKGNIYRFVVSEFD